MPPDCIFSTTPPSSLLLWDKGVGPCSGASSSLRDVKSLKSPLYGAKHSLDLLLLRAGRIVNWNDPVEVYDVESKFICKGHLSSLLLTWKRNVFGNKKNGKKKWECSLPGITHTKKKPPLTSARITKIQAIEYMKNLGSLCHVGTLICTTHSNALEDRNFEAFKFSQPKRKPAQGDDIALDSSDFLDDPIYVQPHSRESSPESENAPDNINALRSVLSAFGITRVISEKPWNQLEYETKRRKVRSVVEFLDELFKIAAGDEWEVMREDFRNQMKIVQKDERVEEIMNTIGHCLEETSERKVRISVLKLITGIFSEKEISEATGASRYLIRQAKLASFDDVLIMNTFKRERYVKDMVRVFLRFLSRPEILTMLPNSCKIFTLGDGNQVSIAQVARSYSYREIYTLFIRYCEEVGKIRGIVNASDLNEFIRVYSLGYSTAYKLMEVITPIRKIRMSCVDSFQAAAYDAFDSFSGMVEELVQLNEIDTQKSVELKRRIRVAKNFMFALQAFSNMVESTEDAKIAVHEDSIVPLVNGEKSEEKKTGWALRRNDRSGALDAGVKMEVERMVNEQLDGGRRAEAREIRDQLRDLRLPDGSYRFPLKKCLSESQVKSQITRILNLKKKQTDGKKKDSEKKPRGRPAKRPLAQMEEEVVEDRSDDDDEEEFNCLEAMENVVERMIDSIFEND